MDNTYKIGYWVLVTLMVGHVVFMHLNPASVEARMEDRLMVKADSSTVIIVPEEIKTVSDNPYYPTRLIGFISRDTLYITFVPDKEELSGIFMYASMKTH